MNPANNDHAFLQAMQALRGEGPLRQATLVQLSDMTPANLQVFQETFASLPEARRLAVARRLAEWQDQNTLVDYYPVFVRMLADASPLVRLAALTGLHGAGSAAHVPTVLSMLESDEDVAVRAESAHLLGNYVFLSFCGLLSRQTAEDILPRLMRQLDAPETPLEIRRRALVGAAFAADEKVHAHIEAAYDHADAGMQASAITAMGVSGDHRWLGVVGDEMESPYAEMRLVAAEAAGLLGKSDLLDRLLKLVEEDEREIQLAAIEAMGRIGGDGAQQMLEELLEDPEFDDLVEALEEALDELEWSGGLDELPLFDFDPDDGEPNSPFSAN